MKGTSVGETRPTVWGTVVSLVLDQLDGETYSVRRKDCRLARSGLDRRRRRLKLLALGQRPMVVGMRHGEGGERSRLSHSALRLNEGAIQNFILAVGGARSALQRRSIAGPHLPLPQTKLAKTGVYSRQDLPSFTSPTASL